MKQKTKIAMIALVIMLFILSCSIIEVDNSPVNGSSSNSNSTSKSTFTDKTEIVIIDLEVKPDMRINLLKINNFKLDEGIVSLRLLDPDKEIHLDKTLSAPAKYHEHFDLEIIPGFWQLEIEMSDASGSYNIKWEAKE